MNIHEVSALAVMTGSGELSIEEKLGILLTCSSPTCLDAALSVIINLMGDLENAKYLVSTDSTLQSLVSVIQQPIDGKAREKAVWALANASSNGLHLREY